MTQEALKLALEALYFLPALSPAQNELQDAAIEAIKEALAQPDPYKQGYADAMNWKVQNHLEHLPTAQPEQEPNKDGSPCPEFWDWLPKAYNFDGNGAFTKYNMEVAFLAGKQASQPEQEPVAWIQPNHLQKARQAPFLCRVEPKQRDDFVPLYTTPPQRKPLTSKEIRAIEVEVAMSNSFAHPTKAEEFVRAIEAAHGIKE